jgi:hypothetical protein
MGSLRIGREQETSMGTRKRRTWLFVTGAVLAVAVVGAFGLQWWIRMDVRVTADAAATEFSGDRVQALARLVDCERCPLNRRNRAVWALGEMGDAAALPTLREHYTGAPCDHDTALCQYELDKAIRKIEGNWGLRDSFRRAFGAAARH